MEGLKKKIALFGGSFDPPHRGHAEVARHFAEKTGANGKPLFDEVWLVLTHTHAFGKILLNFATRAELCRRLIEDLGAAGTRVRLCEIEAEIPGETRTVKTLRLLARLHPEAAFTLILGVDLKPQLPRWENFSEIEKLADVVFIPRVGFEAENRLLKEIPFAPEISSHAVRDALEIGGDASAFLTPSVAAYVREKHLYRKGQKS